MRSRLSQLAQTGLPFVTCRVTSFEPFSAGPQRRPLSLTTERLHLRPFRPDDLELFCQFFSNSGFTRFSGGNFNRERVFDFVDKVMRWDREGLPSQFVVTVRETETPIGYCGFFHQTVDARTEIEIGYRLHPDYWNHGFATESARAVRDCGFGHWNLPRLISLIHPENTASRRVAEKNGMTCERETTFKGLPAQVFAIDRERWLNRGGG